jgi:hypothetical protein
MQLPELQQTNLKTFMQQPGCPLCRAIWNMDGRRFSWYVGDGLLDEETLRNVVRALGFCPQHTLCISLLEGNSFLWSHLGSCMIYATVIEQAILPDLQTSLQRSENALWHPFRQKLFSSFRHFFHRELCPMCFDHRQHETMYLQNFVQAFHSSQDFRLAYSQADSLCFPHFRQVLAKLTDQELIGQLEEVERRGLEEMTQRSSLTTPGELRFCLSQLAGADMFLWSDVLPRATLHSFRVKPPACFACQKWNNEVTLSSLLDSCTPSTSGEKQRRQVDFALCLWHGCWLHQQVEQQPEKFSHFEPILLQTLRQLAKQMREGEFMQGPCSVCTLMNEQATWLGKWFESQSDEAGQSVPLCLAHARLMLQHDQDEKTLPRIAMALLQPVAPLEQRLNAYIYKCSERLQDQMQPDEEVAWFDAMQWFGGKQIAAFLLKDERL